jgi:hypothetical protein
MAHNADGRVEQSVLKPQAPPSVKSDSMRAQLAHDVARLFEAGSSHRAIAAALGVSIRKVQTVLRTASTPKPFRPTERDADYCSVSVALIGGSTFAIEHQKYAAHAPAPYSLSHFWHRFEGWRVSGPAAGSGQALSAPPAGVEPTGGSAAAPASGWPSRPPMPFLKKGGRLKAGCFLLARRM